MSLFDKLFGNKGSAFARVAEHEEAINAAKGKLVSLQHSYDAHSEELDELEQDTNTVHEQRDEISKRLETFGARL